MSGPPFDWYRGLASHLGEAYLRYAFTASTTHEVEFLVEGLGLKAGDRLLDVGMGPGRHAIGFAKRGLEVVGIDISEEFVGLAREAARSEGVSASFFVMDAHHMPFEEEFDAVVSICEGAFSLGLDDLAIIRGMSRALRPQGMAAIAAVNLLYVCKHLSDDGELDAATLLYREISEVKGADGTTQTFEMWNSPYTPRELRWIANGAALEPLSVWGIAPGDYRKVPPSDDHPELLMIAEKPESDGNL